MAVRRVPALSQCMIVKNEEKNIRRALSWGRDIMLEQIVVDTGSTDRTVEIAREMGAQVYYFEWIDDFAAAKNFAIEKAKGSWIAFLDADEYVPQEQVPEILPFLRKVERSGCNMVLTDMLHLDGNNQVCNVDTKIRFFRNLPEIRYRSKIHENLYMTAGEPCYVDAREAFAIMHTGYFTDAAQVGVKGRRNLPLMLKALEEAPDDYDMMGCLGDGYYAIDEKAEAEKWYRRAIALMPEVLSPIDQRSSLTFVALMSVLESGSTEELEKVYEEARRRIPQEADFDFILGSHYFYRERYDRAAEHLKRAIDIVEKYGNISKSGLSSGKINTVYEALSVCYYRLGDLSACVSYAAAVLKVDRYMYKALNVLLLAFHAELEKKGEPGQDEMLAFLRSIYDIENKKDCLFLIRAILEGGHKKLAQKLKATLPPEEASLLNLPT